MDYKDKILNHYKQQQDKANKYTGDFARRHPDENVEVEFDEEYYFSVRILNANLETIAKANTEKLEELYSINADVYVAHMTIKAINNNLLFKKLMLNDKSEKDYRDSVKAFRNKVMFIQHACDETIEVTIPIRPRDALLYAMESIGFNYDNETVESIARIIQSDFKRKPKETKTKLEYDYKEWLRTIETFDISEERKLQLIEDAAEYYGTKIKI